MPVLNEISEHVLVNNTALTVTIYVPVGEVWRIASSQVFNGDDVIRYTTLLIYLPGQVLLRELPANLPPDEERVFLPALAHALYGERVSVPLPLKEPAYIRYSWSAGGVSAGGVARYTLNGEYLI